MSQSAEHALFEPIPYVAPRWLRSPHLQTIWGPFFRRLPKLDFELIRVPTPDDDFLRIHVLEPGDPQAEAPNRDPLGSRGDQPTVLILHGLEGCVRSHNVLGMAGEIARLGWSVVVMEHRSCGGELNRARRLYHSGETSDVEFMANRLAEARPDRELYLFGISLGGNVLAKWLGESPQCVPAAVKGAAVLCPPFDLTRSGPAIDSALGGLYVKRFLRTLIPKAIEKEKQYPGCVDVDKVRASTTFEEFDTYGTAALHGFRDAQDYWEQVSCGQFLEAIRVPTLLLAAADDPFNPGTTLPHSQVASNPIIAGGFSLTGGHTGMVSGPPWRTHCWGERQAAEFFATLHQSRHARPSSGG